MPNRLILAGLKGMFRVMASLDPPAPLWDPSSIRSILLINTTALGDTLFSTPAIRAVRRAFPGAKLVALAGRTARSVLAHNPHLDKIIDHPGRVTALFFFRLPGLLRKIRNEKCDLAIILHGNDPDAVPLAYLSGARYRVGWRGSGLSFLLTRPLDFDLSGKHFIEIWQGHLSALGIPPRGVEMELTLSDAEEREGERLLPESRKGSGKIVGLHPFANKLREKKWPLERVAELGSALYDRGHLPVLFGGPKEKGMAESLVSKSDGKVVSMAGRLSIRQTMSLIKRCDLFITLDSGPMHIAQALRVPIVALYGPSDPRETGPLKGPAIVLKNGFPCSPCGWTPCPYRLDCMESIEVKDVMEAVDRMIGRASPGTSPQFISKGNFPVGVFRKEEK